MCPVGSVWNNVLELALSSRGVITIAIANKNCTIHVILAESSKKNLSLSKSRQAKYSNQRVVVKLVFFFQSIDGRQYENFRSKYFLHASTGMGHIVATIC